ncbi:DUF4139 domain-containing protein [Streptomyces cellulosae]|uniref:DUF4139 domain-containing protein n=2 Tax=Streptomyces TaxID=1883 RepID=A0ABU0KEP8_9ACTN|nr:hypothetical protein [Streptomyces thermodiastaticus]WSB45253.1 DUF4139 domain-containing protein [Streptomyces cellulosae]WSB58089.1 DUF4139 domain-containing protein [Streptomyces cellulosae]WTB73143.1 DUF4139 domain-containing protein [Streptomyces cellulosae]WTF24258.1 DUF4139 domain-containing protein [Streptomyces cellulosae]
MTAGTAPRWDSALESVTVYAQGALCRRVARGTVPADGQVRVPRLPRSLDPHSLRARVLGAPGVRVAEARAEVDAEPVDAEAVAEARREVDRLAEAYHTADARRDRQLKRIEEVGALRPVPPGRKRDDPHHRRTPVDAWLELAGFVDERLTALHAGLRELEDELRRLEHEMDLAHDRLDRASTDAPASGVASSYTAVLTLRGGAGAEAEVEIEYGVPGAVWVPAYRLTHRQGEDSGRLVLRASVAQRSGEDWTGVRIAFATADLRRRTDLPRLRSVRIGRSQPAPAPSGWREPPAGLTDLFAGYDAAGPRPDPHGLAEERAGGWVAGGPGADTSLAAGAAYGSPPTPPPPPPPAPAALSDPGAVYGAPPQGFGGPAAPGSAPAADRARLRSRPGSGPRSAAAPRAGGGAYAAAPESAGAAAYAPPPPVPGPPRPDDTELDYAALVLSGPDEARDRRGRLFHDAGFDPVTAEYRRRAEKPAALPLPGHAVRPRESAGSFDHRYDAVAPADIPSDGTWHTVTVGEIAVGLRTEYVCVPAVEQTVYATLVLSNATDQALLAGPVEVSVDGEYQLTAALPTLAPGGVRRLGLGPAEAIGVTRRTHLTESTAGLRNNVTVLDHRVRVELANRLPAAVRVEVRERVPVTSEADVRIEERADWTEPENTADRERHAPGTRIWRVDLPAGGTVALDGGYEIRIPAGKALTGGNRRS